MLSFTSFLFLWANFCNRDGLVVDMRRYKLSRLLCIMAITGSPAGLSRVNGVRLSSAET